MRQLASCKSNCTMQVVFKEVVPIRDASLRAKIHQTYRMGYVKDVVLPRSLDDNGFTALSSLMLLNNVEVVTSLQSVCYSEDGWPLAAH